jgi:hypothetical protein
MTYLRPYVTGSNNTILNEVGRTMSVFGWGTSGTMGCVRTQLWDTSSWSHWATSVLGSGFSMTSRDWWLSSHKGQWRFYDRSLPRGGIITLGYYYGLPGMNAAGHSYGGNFDYLSCLPRVLIRCRKPLGLA